MKLLLGILIASSFFLTSCGVIEDILGGEDEPEVSQEATPEAAETPTAGATAGAEEAPATEATEGSSNATKSQEMEKTEKPQEYRESRTGS